MQYVHTHIHTCKANKGRHTAWSHLFAESKKKSVETGWLSGTGIMGRCLSKDTNFQLYPGDRMLTIVHTLLCIWKLLRK